ncbi:hypothetical protein [Halobacterium salinarum]|uniref:hypothetical protein n=1 Tax=Halobacterium salinarum TaxID=2242 RepID=UPI002556FAFB|nr:hypothetical protein [Halobacterium salinarum]MDL0126305.1 hypothetical protein [Halobacterium salinarum]MDL0145849.1 hypothetical protein [Halobacterium salinarum]
MAQSPLIAVAGTVAGTVLGAGIQYWSARKSAEEASERVFEERAADAKFERLEKLHDSLDDCRRQFREVIFQGPNDVEDYYTRVREPYDEFREASNKARMYLDSEQRKTVESTIETFNEHRTELKFWAMQLDDDYPDSQKWQMEDLSREEIDESADAVFDMIRLELDPDADK